MLPGETVEKIKLLCGKHKEIALLYVFGSVARGDAGPLSDYDFAVYLKEIEPQKRFEAKLSLIGELTSILQSNKVDVVVMNDADNINLKYAIIKEGKLICQKEPFKMIIESKILNEYFDFRIFIDKYQKTK